MNKLRNNWIQTHYKNESVLNKETIQAIQTNQEIPTLQKEYDEIKQKIIDYEKKHDYIKQKQDYDENNKQLASIYDELTILIQKYNMDANTIKILKNGQPPTNRRDNNYEKKDGVVKI